MVLNRGAAAHKGAMRKCQGCHQFILITFIIYCNTRYTLNIHVIISHWQLSVLLTFRPILASRYRYSWPRVKRGKKGWETLVYGMVAPAENCYPVKTDPELSYSVVHHASGTERRFELTHALTVTPPYPWENLAKWHTCETWERSHNSKSVASKVLITYVNIFTQDPDKRYWLKVTMKSIFATSFSSVTSATKKLLGWKQVNNIEVIKNGIHLYCLLLNYTSKVK